MRDPLRQSNNCDCTCFSETRLERHKNFRTPRGTSEPLGLWEFSGCNSVSGTRSFLKHFGIVNTVMTKCQTMADFARRDMTSFQYSGNKLRTRSETQMTILFPLSAEHTTHFPEGRWCPERATLSKTPRPFPVSLESRDIETTEPFAP